MVWDGDNRTGVARQIAVILQRLERVAPSSAKAVAERTWLDAGQRASLLALRERLCSEGKLGMILADEVGMGKTRIAVALALAVNKAGGRVVVVVPPGLLHQWRREFQEAMIEAGEPPLEIPNITSIRQLLASHGDVDFQSGLTRAKVVLLPHGLLNFQMKHGGGSQWLLERYQWCVAGRRKFSAMINHAEKKILHNLVDRLGSGHKLLPKELQVGGSGRAAFVSFALSRLGAFDLLVIDEAHKSKGTDAPKLERSKRTTLSQLLDRLERSEPRRLCLTATPFELDAKNWGQILTRAGAKDEAESCVKASEKFSAAVKSVRLAPTAENAAAFEKASEEFRNALSPWLLRRRKAVSGDSSGLGRYVRDHGPNYRDIDSKVSAKISGKDWPRAIMAVEALSIMPATRLAQQKRLRFALARGFSLSAAIDAADRANTSDWSAQDNKVLAEGTVEPGAPGQADRREARAQFWLSTLKPAAANPFTHPALLAAVAEIEKITTLSVKPEKVLVFGIFTQAMRRLTDLLNAREMIRRLMVFSHDPKAPLETWHWPGEVIPTDFQESLSAACTMEDMRALLGDTSTEDLERLIKQQYARYRVQREKVFEQAKSYVTATIAPGLGLSKQDERQVQRLTLALTELMDEQKSHSEEVSCTSAWNEFLRLNLPQQEEDEAPVVDGDTLRMIEPALEDYDGNQGRFARRLAGGMKAATKQHLQSAFNRRTSWPMVLVAQSLVGREGLNLHRSCRTVVLFQPEWNPAVVEQQIGRVDRMGSFWEEMVERHDGNDHPPKIRVLRVEFSGTYDEHNWKVLNHRWDNYRAQMNGEVFMPDQQDDLVLQELKLRVNQATPDFSPPPQKPSA